MSALVVLSSFLAAGVEWVEALTIVLAVGLFRGWRNAVLGMALAFAALLALVAILGTAVGGVVSLPLARTLVGVFLLLFGLKWLHKAILRSSGLKALHDEEAAFAETREQLERQGGTARWVGVSTSFGGVLLEGLEVVFIVIALGGLNSVPAATAGALSALAVVAVAGVALRRPLTRVPENAVKYVVGIMLTSFGTFFAGEGIGVVWWHSDLSLLVLVAVYGLVSLGLVWALRRRVPAGETRLVVVRAARAVVTEVWGLFVGDGPLAVACLAAVAGVAVFTDRAGQAQLAGVLLVAGVVLAVVIGLAGPFRAAAALQPARPTPVPEPEPAAHAEVAAERTG
jgi:Ca2+/H+ antiporter, TMEM165/GDT1 family